MAHKPNMARVIAVQPAQENGAHTVLISMGRTETLAAEIVAKDVPMFLTVMQRDAIEMAVKQNKDAAFPTFAVSDVNLAHQGTATQLLVATDSIGVVVLTLRDAQLAKLRQMLDHAALMRSGPKAKQ